VSSIVLLVEAELHQRINGLAERALRKVLARDAVGKAGDIDDPLVGVEELRLASRAILGFDNERGQRPVSRGQTGG
jgi:hypothetical protein